MPRRVRVYYNLHKGKLSVLDKRTRRIVDHVDSIKLKDIKFIVSEAGVKRIRKQKRKSVVAFVEGKIIKQNNLRIPTSPKWKQVYFCPYKTGEFVIGNDPIYTADECVIVNNKMFCKER